MHTAEDRRKAFRQQMIYDRGPRLSAFHGSLSRKELLEIHNQELKNQSAEGYRRQFANFKNLGIAQGNPVGYASPDPVYSKLAEMSAWSTDYDYPARHMLENEIIQFQLQIEKRAMTEEVYNHLHSTPSRKLFHEWLSR